MRAGCGDAMAPKAEATPCGVFLSLIRTDVLDGKLLRDALGGAPILCSTTLEDGSSNEGECSFPRIFDMYATMSESGLVKSLYVCCGLATPMNLSTSELEPNKAFALGIEVAVIASGGRAHGGERVVQFREKGRAIDERKEVPIIAHPLGDIKMRIRPVDGVKGLTEVLGSQARCPPPPLAETPSSV
jgi:hypothetical protein